MFKNDILGLADQVYQQAREQMEIQPHDDPSRLGICAYLSRNLFHALQAENIPAQREFHRIGNNGSWHLLVSHGSEPSPDELVTDMCPWQFIPKSIRTGVFHGTRAQLHSTLVESGAIHNKASLVDLSTLALRHTLGMGLSSFKQDIHQLTMSEKDRAQPAE